METTMNKIGRTMLAVLLAAFVCLAPASISAFAEEEPQASAEEDPFETVPDTEEPEPIEPELETESLEDPEIGEDEAALDAEPVSTAILDTDDLTADAAANELSADALETSAVASGAAAEADDAHTFDIGTTLDLMDVFKYDINAHSNESFVINLTDDIVLLKPTDRIDTHGKRLFIGTDRLCVKNGNTVTILGHGHSIIYENGSVNNLTIGARDGNLILGAPDGSDSLTLTFSGEGHSLQALVDLVGGTLTMYDGVTLSNNINFTAYAGGGISASGGAVINMYGGIIENNTNGNITWGGGVNIDGATFNMYGGVIKGNSEPEANTYPGMGGGVALSSHGTASAFTMSGDAIIEGNSAAYGGGVYVGPNGTFTMSGNASIKNNTSTLYGGGVYVAQGGTFTMGDDNDVIGNKAVHGGGVMNFGTASVTNVYDNDATSSGADIYNGGSDGGTITMIPVKAEWSLSRDQATSDPNGSNGSDSNTPTDNQPDLPSINFMSLAVSPQKTLLSNTGSEDAAATATVSNPSNKTIDGWYYDGHRETGDTDENGNAVVDHSRWNANKDTADTPQYLMNYEATGTPTNETMGLKAAHGETTAPESGDDPTPATINVLWENYDGAVLFELDKVEVGHVPPASEYTALSGNENPTEPSKGDTDYEFEGWERSVEPDGDVVYTALYEPETHDVPSESTEDVTPPVPITDTQTATPDVESEGAALQQTGDGAMFAVLVFGGIALIALSGVGIAVHGLRKARKQMH